MPVAMLMNYVIGKILWGLKIVEDEGKLPRCPDPGGGGGYSSYGTIYRYGKIILVCKQQPSKSSFSSAVVGLKYFH